MDNMEETIGKLLSDPGVMAQIASLAGSIGGPAASGQHGPSPEERHTALFRALMPFLSEKRQRKLEKAMQLAKLGSFAGGAMQVSDGAQEGR